MIFNTNFFRIKPNRKKSLKLKLKIFPTVNFINDCGAFIYLKNKEVIQKFKKQVKKRHTHRDFGKRVGIRD